MSEVADDIEYEDAMTELETILSAVEHGGVSLDALGGKVARAAELIRTCQAKIKRTEMTVQSILDDLETNQSAGQE
jgi:exodeoxyribonuclease VII small subunit